MNSISYHCKCCNVVLLYFVTSAVNTGEVRVLCKNCKERIHSVHFHALELCSHSLQDLREAPEHLRSARKRRKRRAATALGRRTLATIGTQEGTQERTQELSLSREERTPRNEEQPPRIRRATLASWRAGPHSRLAPSQKP